MNNFYLIFRELFYVISLAIVVFATMEFLWPKIILAYFNLNILLIAWFINAIVMLALSNEVNNNDYEKKG